MGKDGKVGFSPTVSAIFIQIKKNIRNTKFVVEWYQILFKIIKLTFSAVTYILKSIVFESNAQYHRHHQDGRAGQVQDHPLGIAPTRITVDVFSSWSRGRAPRSSMNLYTAHERLRAVQPAQPDCLKELLSIYLISFVT